MLVSQQAHSLACRLNIQWLREAISNTVRARWLIYCLDKWDAMKIAYSWNDDSHFSGGFFVIFLLSPHSLKCSVSSPSTFLAILNILILLHDTLIPTIKMKYSARCRKIPTQDQWAKKNRNAMANRMIHVLRVWNK